MFGFFFSFCLGLSESAKKIDQNQKKKKIHFRAIKIFYRDFYFISYFSLHELYFMPVYRLMCFADNCLLKIDK